MRGSIWKLFGLLGITLLTAGPVHAEVRIGVAAPLTGALAWAGSGVQKGAELAVEDLNALGGALGQRVEMITVDDYCSGNQAIAAARKLVDSSVVAVLGHPCSGAAIPASAIYANASVLMISNLATNPKLTEQGFTNVFRVAGRDDVQGRIAGDFLVERFPQKRLAILHDGEAYGRGLAEETKRRVNELGKMEAMFDAIEPGAVDYSDVVRKLQAAGVELVYFGGYAREAALILRQARQRDYELQLVGGDGLGTKDFAFIAGSAADGALMSQPPEPIASRATPALVEALSVDIGPFNTFTTYAALQAWFQAVEQVGTFGTDAVADALRSHEFDTVLGRIGFDEKGDVTGYETFVWYEWRDGNYTPLEPGKLTE